MVLALGLVDTAFGVWLAIIAFGFLHAVHHGLPQEAITPGVRRFTTQLAIAMIYAAARLLWLGVAR